VDEPDRTPFDVTIALPGGRVYHARAEIAVMLSSARAGDPDRLTVQLPPADPDTAAQLTGEYARRGWTCRRLRRPAGLIGPVGRFPDEALIRNRRRGRR
jgi:hypothetical protein